MEFHGISRDTENVTQNRATCLKTACFWLFLNFFLVLDIIHLNHTMQNVDIVIISVIFQHIM